MQEVPEINMSSRVVKLKEATVFEYPAASGEEPPSPSGQHQVDDSSADEASTEHIDEEETVERDAFQKGYDAGLKAGAEQTQQQVDEVSKKLAGSLEELAGLRRKIIAESETDLVKLAIEIAKKLVHREIQIDERIIIALVRVALEKLTERTTRCSHKGATQPKPSKGW